MLSNRIYRTGTPLIEAGLIAPETGLSAPCVSGYSGGGKAMIARYEAGAAPAYGTLWA